MCPIYLEGALPVVVEGGKRRNRRGSAVSQHCPVEAAVNSVILEVFVGADKILCSVPHLRGAEIPLVDQGQVARQIVRGRGSTPRDARAGRMHGYAAHIGGEVGGEDMRSSRALVVLLRPRDELRVGK